MAEAVAGLLPELEGRPDIATVLAEDPAVPLQALGEALVVHVERVTRFGVNPTRNNAELRAIQHPAATHSIDPDDVTACFAAGDCELHTQTAEGRGRFHKTP